MTLEIAGKSKAPRVAERPVLALPIFPGGRPPSIVGSDELNYRVRNGNGWTLILINTNWVCTLKTEQRERRKASLHNRRSSPRAISTGQLHTLPRFHPRPIYQVVFLGPYLFSE